MIAVTARFAQARLGRWTVSHWVLRGVVLGLFVLWCGLALAQPAEKRVALVIGNSAYRHTPALANPRNDAKDLAAALRSAGFEVTEGLDLDKQGMDIELARFARSAQDASAALIFYAGHGLQYQGRNYLVPVDAKLEDEIGIQFETTSLEDLMSAFVRVKGVQILVLDACRNNPLAGRLAERQIEIGKGLSRISSPRGMLVASATQADEVAFDGKGRNSFFTAALVSELTVPGLEVHELFRRVAAAVNQETGGKQLPETSSSLGAAFFLNPGETDEQAWAALRESSDVADLRAFVAQYPQSLLADAATARIELIERIAADAAPKEPEPVAAEVAEEKPDEQKAAAATEIEPPAEGAEAKVAALQPTAPPPEAPSDSGADDGDALVRDAQIELRRIGCYRGSADGKLGRDTRDALADYFEQLGLALPDRGDTVDAELVRRLQASQGTDCLLAGPDPAEAAEDPALASGAPAEAMPSCDELLEEAQLGELTDEVQALIQRACQ